MAAEQKTFVEIFLQETAEDYRRRGIWALTPLWLFTSAALAAGVVYFIPASFYSESNQEVSTTVLAGILAFNAITLALSWSAIGKILETITQKDFCSFLREHGLLDSYRMYVEMIHWFQIAASLTTVITMLVLLVDNTLSTLIHQSLLISTVTLTLYAMRWSHGAVQISNDLIWWYAKFDSLNEEERDALRMVVNNG